MDRNDIRKILLKRYLVMLSPALVILGAWAAYRNLVAMPEPVSPKITGPAFFIAAVVLAVGLPLLIRDRFVKRVAKEKSVTMDDFLAFENSILTVSLLASYCAAGAYICTTAQIFFAGAFLAALYAAYYYFPSMDRVRHETRLFRIPTDDQPPNQNPKG